MKPIMLEIQAFGPFADRQIVDFEKLAKGGIFLIKGKTGSGKTTIFDAMTFALYGGSSGTGDKIKTGRNDFEAWRCNQATPDTPTEVSFTFSVHGRKYNFTRMLTMGRKNLSAKYSAGELDEAGNSIPFFNNPKKEDLNRKAEELIGLTRDQFRQVVLLPQGQFERFLTASSEEKEAILKTIFNSERWEKYAQKFFDTANEHKKNLETEKLEVEAALARESEENGISLIEPEQLISLAVSLQEKLNELEEQHTAFNGKKKQNDLNADILLAEQFRSLHLLEKRSGELAASAEKIRERKVRYEEAEAAEKFRGLILDYEAAEKEYCSRKTALNQLVLRLPKAKSAAEEAEKIKQDKEAVSPVPELQGKIGELNAKKAFYEKLSSIQKEYNAAEKSKLTAEEELRKASGRWTQAEEKAAASYNDRKHLEEIAGTYRDRYYLGIYGELAAKLTEGKPCPVCGSPQHPSPAEKMPDSVSEADVKAKEELLKKSIRIWEADEEKRKLAEAEKNSCLAELTSCTVAFSQVEADLKAARSNLMEGIPDSDALERSIDLLSGQIRSFCSELEALEKTAKDTAKALDSLNTYISSAEAEKHNAEEKRDSIKIVLDRALAENGFSDYLEVKGKLLPNDTRSALHKELISYETECRKNLEDLHSKRTELDGVTEPDTLQFEARQEEIRQESDAFTNRQATLRYKIDHLMKLQAELSGKWNHYSGEIRQAENDLAFARKLRGDSGFGLQRYVLAVMFNQMIGEANQMLAKVHGGRYQLSRSDEKGVGNKRGLELKVHDNRCPDQEGRPVAMLSGGEKFLVSLALSIGMSTVAQKSGVQIDALFIDEGFGTLDDNSIDDAMDVLETVRRTSSTIGIISHVQLLESTISTQLEVVKAESGNYIRMP